MDDPGLEIIGVTSKSICPNDPCYLRKNNCNVKLSADAKYLTHYLNHQHIKHLNLKRKNNKEAT